MGGVDDGTIAVRHPCWSPWLRSLEALLRPLDETGGQDGDYEDEDEGEDEDED